MPYIDRCKLLKDLCKTSAPTPGENWIVQKCVEIVNKQPSADVVPRSEWISVDERLPEIEGVYLAYTARRTIEVAHFYPYYVNGKPQFDYWITHWMPLPEAPKKGGAE